MAGASLSNVKFEKLMKVYNTFSIQEKNFIIPVLVEKCRVEMNDILYSVEKKSKEKVSSSIVDFEKYKEKRLMV